MLDYNALTAWAAVTASAVAVYGIWAESKRSRFAMGMDLFLKLEADFDGENMRTKRRAAAKALLHGKELGDVDDLLDFFEMVGMLVRRGALDDLMVWHNFFYWIRGYCLSSAAYIDESRIEDSTVWADLVKLNKRMMTIEKKERQCSERQLELSDDKITEFLEWEMKI
jgi:hypothetical protein